MRKNIKIFVNYFLGPLLFVILAYSLYNQVSKQKDLDIRWEQIKLIWQRGLFWLVIVLMFVNWGLEAQKWKRLLQPLQKISFITALKSVFAGCSITMLTPNRIGEYGGRVLYVKEENRISAIPLTILGGISQLIVTLLMGTAGLLYLKYFVNEPTLLFAALPAIAANIFIYVGVVLSIVLWVFYFEAGFMVKLIKKAGFLKGIVKYLLSLQQFARKDLLRILFLSFLRYLVFILQYLLLLQLLEVKINPATCFWLLTIFYLLLALAPTIGFTELPVRAAASVEILQLYSSNILGIQAASFGIWVINLVIPALIGSILIFTIKIIKDNEVTL